MKEIVIKSLITLLAIGLLTSCQMEKRQYMRGFFIKKTACKPDSCRKEIITDDDTVAGIQKVNKNSFTQNEIVHQQNDENLVAAISDAGTNDLFVAKTDNTKQFALFLKDTASNKLEKLIQHDFQRVVTNADDPPKVHPLVKVAAAVLLFDIIAIYTLPQFNISGKAVWVIFILCLPIASIVLLTIALRKTKKNPDKWIGLGCITASIICLFFVLIISLLVTFSIIP